MVEFPLKQVEVGSWNPIILGKLLQLPNLNWGYFLGDSLTISM